MNRLVAIRFDVSREIGTGHVTRALAFGAELEKRNLSYFYVTDIGGVDFAKSIGVAPSKLHGFDADAGEADWIQRNADVTDVIVISAIVGISIQLKPYTASYKKRTTRYCY